MVYKGGKKRHLAAASWVDKQTRAGAGEEMVMGSNPARLFEFFFSHLRKFLSFWRANCRYSKHKISSTGTDTLATAFMQIGNV